jgi:hypothetical protein
VHSSRVHLAFALIAIIAVDMTGYRLYRSDMSAWRDVQQSLVQLHAELERAPAASLTSEIAAVRSGLDRYASSVHRFPRDKTRLLAAERGVAYLEIAANGARDIRTWKSMTAYSEVTRFLPRSCEGGRLAFSPDLIGEAFAVAGSSLIKGGALTSPADDGDDDHRQMGFYGPLDLAKETAACRQVEQTVPLVAPQGSQTAEPVHKVRGKYRIDVVNPTGCLMTPYSDDQTLPLPHSQIYSFHLDATREARLDKVFCDSGKPEAAIAIRVNGQSYEPVWLLDESGINYATQLVPRAALVISTDGAP